MNRRGDTSILILVILILLVTSSSLFAFWRGAMIPNKTFSDYVYSDSLYAQENSFSSALNSFGEKTYLKIYLDFIQNAKFLKERKLTIIEPYTFVFSLNPILSSQDLDEKFKKEFKSSFIKDLSKLELEDSKEGLYLLKNFFPKDDLKQIEKFSVLGSADNLELSIDYSSETESQDSEFSFKSSHKISNSVSAEEIGLIGFETLRNFLNICKTGNLDEKIICFKQTGADSKIYDVKTAEENNGKIFIVLITEKKFLISGSEKPIEISFIVE